MYWPVHPAAALFPMLSKASLRELQRDIELNGQREPIKLWRGKLIDGRNRLEAIKGTVATPITQEMNFIDDAEAIAYIVSTNLRRRHLTPSAVAKIGAELANLSHGSNQHGAKVEPQHCGSTDDQTAKPVSAALAASMTGASKRSIEMAAAVKKHAPDLFKRIDKDLSVNKAYKLMRERMPKKPGKVKVEPAPTDPPPSVQTGPDFADHPDPPPYIPPAEPAPIPAIKSAEIAVADALAQATTDDFDGWFNSPEGKRMELIARSIREMLRNNGVKLWRHPDNDIGAVVGVDEPSDDNFKWIGV